MNIYKITNVPLSDFRKFLFKMGAKHKRTRGGHEIYFHKDLPRSIPIQSHVDPVPSFIVDEVLKYFNISKKDMWNIIKSSKGTTERKSKTSKRGKRSTNKN
jgi:predicted RNA binding protein YcfA (HicA-like mRNA interferase family)